MTVLNAGLIGTIILESSESSSIYFGAWTVLFNLFVFYTKAKDSSYRPVSIWCSYVFGFASNIF